MNLKEIDMYLIRTPIKDKWHLGQMIDKLIEIDLEIESFSYKITKDIRSIKILEVVSIGNKDAIDDAINFIDNYPLFDITPNRKITDKNLLKQFQNASYFSRRLKDNSDAKYEILVTDHPHYPTPINLELWDRTRYPKSTFQ